MYGNSYLFFFAFFKFSSTAEWGWFAVLKATSSPKPCIASSNHTQGGRNGKMNFVVWWEWFWVALLRNILLCTNEWIRLCQICSAWPTLDVCPLLFRDGVTHLNVVIQLFLEIRCSCKLAHFHRYNKTKAFCYVKCFGSIFLIFYANPINWKCAGHGIRMSVHFASHIFFSSFSFSPEDHLLMKVIFFFL